MEDGKQTFGHICSLSYFCIIVAVSWQKQGGKIEFGFYFEGSQPFVAGEVDGSALGMVERTYIPGKLFTSGRKWS